jgi:hypothetical protein
MRLILVGMAKLLYVADFVDRCAPPTEDHRPTWIRRCQLWADAGILPAPIPEPKGRGRRRRVYGENTVPLAAVLLRLSDLGIETGFLKWISTSLQNDTRGRGRFARFWQAALKGDRSTAYISFSLQEGKYSYRYDEKEFGLMAWTSTLADQPEIFLNLTSVFVEVRHAAEE